MNNKITQTLINILLLTTTALAIYLLIFRRLFRKELIFVLNTENIQQDCLFFISLFFCSLAILILFIVSFLYSKQQSTKKLTTFSKILLKIHNYIEKYNIFYIAYGIVFNFFGYKRVHRVVNYTNNILEYSDKKNFFLILITVAVPRIIILLCFIYEIYNKQLHYYFFSLSLLVIPLTFRFLIFVFKDLPKKMLPVFNAKYVETKVQEDPIIIPAGTPITPKEPKKFTGIGIKFKPEYAQADLNYFLSNYYYPMLYITGHMELTILPLYLKIHQLTIFIYTIIHVLGWGYILFYLL